MRPITSIEFEILCVKIQKRLFVKVANEHNLNLIYQDRKLEGKSGIISKESERFT
jgi:hypothetical protein